MLRSIALFGASVRIAVCVAAAFIFTSCREVPSGPPREAVSGSAPQLSLTVGGADIIPGQYIVVFRDDVVDAEGLTTQTVATLGGTLRFRYTSALKGFAAALSDQAVAALRRMPNVAYVEPDQVVRASVTQRMSAAGDPWGLDRVDQRTQPLTKTFTYTATGRGVTAYIIDTGLQANHPEFGTRAQNVRNTIGGSNGDCNGHGTHVAGIVGGRTYGAAKQVQLHGVKVLDCWGEGTTSSVIAGVDWVRRNRVNPAVANLSLGGAKTPALNTAVNNLANAGVFVAVAAGNDNFEACLVSPASATAAFTTAASTRTDAKAFYSNWGSCVDGYAPGDGIKSSWIGSTTRSISGTSMAAPHVTGVAALYKHRFGNQSSAAITTWLKRNATANAISHNRSGTPNKLLFKSTL